MNVALKPKLKKFVENEVKSGRYHSADDVLAAALERLMQDDKETLFSNGELAKLVAEGEADIARGDVLGLAQARTHFRPNRSRAWR